jgi:uncharacterized protein (DUF2147 family)
MRLHHALFITIVMLAPVGAAADPPVDPTGEWLVAKRVARIKIVPCEGKFWGFLSWETEPGTDSNNPDPAKRTRPTLGLPILLGMVPSKPNEWSGEIYNAQDGRKYSSSIKLLNPDLLKVEGCVLGVLCGGENWTRAGPPTTASVPPKSGPAAKSAKGANAPAAEDPFCLEVAAPAGTSH